MREKRNLTQSKLSKLTGVRQGLISSYELGERNPGLKNLMKLADGLNVSVNKLISPPKLNDEQAATTDPDSAA